MEYFKGGEMTRMIFLISIFLVGEMGARGISDKQLLKVVRNGKLTQRFLDRYDVKLAQLEHVVNGETLLTVAIKAQLPETFALLLDAGVNLRKQADGTIPLDIVVEYGTVPMARELLYRDVHLTPQACRLASKREDMFKFFVDILTDIKLGGKHDGENRFNIDRSDVDLCLENMLLTVGTTRELQDLLRKGAHTDYRDERGDVALDYAVRNCLDQNAKILLSQASPAPKEKSVESARLKCEKDLSGASNVCCKTVDIISKTENREKLYQQLIDKIKNRKLTKNFIKEHFTGLNGLNINRTFVELNNEDALSLAVRHCDYDATLLLLKYGASNVQYSFNIALKECPKPLIHLLVKHGAKLYHSLQPFEQVIRFNSDAKSIVKWLAPRVSSRTRQKAFLFACLKADLEVAEILFQAGINVNEIAKDGQSPLWNALLSQNKAIVEWLIAHKVKNEFTSEQMQYMKIYFPVGYQLVVALQK